MKSLSWSNCGRRFGYFGLCIILTSCLKSSESKLDGTATNDRAVAKGAFSGNAMHSKSFEIDNLLAACTFELSRKELRPGDETPILIPVDSKKTLFAMDQLLEVELDKVQAAETHCLTTTENIPIDYRSFSFGSASDDFKVEIKTCMFLNPTEGPYLRLKFGYSYAGISLGNITNFSFVRKDMNHSFEIDFPSGEPFPELSITLHDPKTDLHQQHMVNHATIKCAKQNKDNIGFEIDPNGSSGGSE